MSSANVGVMATGSGTVVVGNVHVGPSGVSVSSTSRGGVVVRTSTNNGGLLLGAGVAVSRLRIDSRGRRRALVKATLKHLPRVGKRKALGPGSMVRRSRTSVYVYGTRLRITPGDRINGVKVGRSYKISGDPEFFDRLIVSRLPEHVVAAIHDAEREKEGASASASASANKEEEDPK